MTDANFADYVKDHQWHKMPTPMLENILYFRYKDNCEGIVAFKQDGSVVTRDEWEDLTEELEEFWTAPLANWLEGESPDLVDSQDGDGRREPTPPPVPFYVYIIQEDDGPCKIGLSSNPERRLGRLKQQSAHDMRIIHTYKTQDRKEAETVERTLHERFGKKWMRSEWFRLTTDDISLAINMTRQEEMT